MFDIENDATYKELLKFNSGYYHYLLYILLETSLTPYARNGTTKMRSSNQTPLTCERQITSIVCSYKKVASHMFTNVNQILGCQVKMVN